MSDIVTKIRVICSKTPAKALFPTRRTAVKYPFMQDESAMAGKDSARILSGKTVRLSPSNDIPMVGDREKSKMAAKIPKNAA